VAADSVFIGNPPAALGLLCVFPLFYVGIWERWRGDIEGKIGSCIVDYAVMFPRKMRVVVSG
jgi:hypothetical protein